MESEIEFSEIWWKESPPELMRFYSPTFSSDPEELEDSTFGKSTLYIKFQRVMIRLKKKKKKISNVKKE